MAGEIQITAVGALGADPELRFTPNGDAVANFSVASTPRVFDRQQNEFRDGETVWLRCNVWREMAENVSATLQRGSVVIVQGRLKSRTFETQQGEKRTVMELDVDEIGPSLRRATAVVTKTNGGASGGYQGGQQAQGNAGGGWGRADQANQQSQGGWGVPPSNQGWS